MPNNPSNSIQKVVALCSVVWLALANAVGLWLAMLLIWPRLGDLLSPLTYGRWVPLHMDWQLYGWCSLPLLGLLLMRFFEEDCEAEVLTVSALGFWSIGLLAGGVTWLSGQATGKPFLNWTGWGGAFFIAAQVAVWSLLAIAFFRSWRRWATGGQRSRKWIAIVLKTGILLSLLGVPLALFILSNPTIYPPVNPDSGGATGHSLLASTLCLVFLMGLLPGPLLRLRWKKGRRKGLLLAFWIAFAGSVFLYASIGHGNASNEEWDQVLGLGSLLIWPVFVALLWQSYEWSSESKLWKRSFFFWWALLAIDGWGIFLPMFLDTLKFTNALVAHSHLAMAGAVTAFNMLILLEMGSAKSVREILGQPRAAWAWNLSCLAFVAVLTLQGWREGNQPGALFDFDKLTETAYIARLLAGGAMFGISAYWVWQSATVFARKVAIEALDDAFATRRKAFSAEVGGIEITNRTADGADYRCRINFEKP